jgi:siroheme synthase (precorrin-2 oxidase/ferrochelatase)
MRKVVIARRVPTPDILTRGTVTITVELPTTGGRAEHVASLIRSTIRHSRPQTTARALNFAAQLISQSGEHVRCTITAREE